MKRLAWAMLCGLTGCSSARVEAGEAVVWSGPFSAEACRIPIAADVTSGETPGNESERRLKAYEWELAAYRLCEARMNNWITNDEYKAQLSELVKGVSNLALVDQGAPKPNAQPAAPSE